MRDRMLISKICTPSSVWSQLKSAKVDRFVKTRTPHFRKPMRESLLAPSKQKSQKVVGRWLPTFSVQRPFPYSDLLRTVSGDGTQKLNKFCGIFHVYTCRKHYQSKV